MSYIVGLAAFTTSEHGRDKSYEIMPLGLVAHTIEKNEDDDMNNEGRTPWWARTQSRTCSKADANVNANEFERERGRILNAFHGSNVSERYCRIICIEIHNAVQ